MQIIQIPLSMFSSTTQPIQIAIPSSVTQQTTQTVTVTSTPQLVTTNASPAQTPMATQSIKIITNTSNLTPTPSSTTPNQTNVTRFITMKTTPQVTSTTAASTTTISLASTSTTPQTNITEQVAQQLKTGSIQLKLNQPALSSQAGTINATSTATTVTPLATTLRLATASPGQTLTALTNSSTVSTSVVSNTITSPVSTTTAGSATVLASPNAKTASLVRTAFQSPVGTRILVQQPNNTSTTIHKVTAPSLKIITSSSQESTDKTTSSDSSNKPFVLTQEIQDRIVRQALLNTNTSTPPEVQQKLLAWQKKQQQPGQVVVTPAIIDSSGTGRTVTPSTSGRSKGVKRARNTSTTTTITPTTVPNVQLTGDDEENRRLLDCQAVLVGILDKIEKDEKMELRRKKAKENQFQSKWKSLLTKKKEILNEQAEILKRDIARKKSLMKEKLRKEIQAEMNRESPIKKKETPPNNKVNSNGTSTTTTTTSSNTNSSSNESTPKRRKLSDSSSDVSRPPLNKIRIKITPLNPKGSTGDSNATNTSTAGNKNKKLYCICKTAYDSSRFMVGCDSCHNWFHTDCLGLDEETVKKKKSWVCNDCRDSDEENGNGDGDEEEEDDEGSTPESSDIEQEVQPQPQPQPQPQTQLQPQQQQPPQLQPLPQLQTQPQPQPVSQSQPPMPTLPPPQLISQRQAQQPTLESQSPQQQEQQQQPQQQQEQQESKVKVDAKTEPKPVPKVEPKVVKTPKKQVKKEIKGKRSGKKDQVDEEEDESRLYCMCRQPYDESLFYIQCDSCQDWLHGKCVGIVSKEAQLLDTYNCPRCAPNSLINYCNQKKLDSKDFSSLKSLMKELKSFRSAWPFLKPVDATVVPDYYSIIKKPMDMATMERKLESTAYATLAQFIGDLTLICDNCRYYNDNKSTFTTCANLLETFFLQRIKSFRQQMLQNK